MKSEQIKKKNLTHYIWRRTEDKEYFSLSLGGAQWLFPSARLRFC